MTVTPMSLPRAPVPTALDESGPPEPPVPAEVLRAACSRVARNGVTGQALDPATGGLVPARQRWRDLVRHAEPAPRRTGELRVVRGLLTTVLRDGSGAVPQRAASRRTVRACRPASVA